MLQLDADRWGDLPGGPRPHTAALGSETVSALIDALWLGPAAIALLDPELRFVEVNEAFAGLVGLERDAFVGCTPRDVLRCDAGLAFGAEDRLRAVLASGEPALDLTATSRTQEGATRWWRASLYPAAGDGSVRGICAIVEETTHVHDRERQLERAWAAADRSARRLALLQRLTSTLSAASEPREIAEAVIARVQAFAEADAASIRVLEPDGLAPLAWAGLRPPAASVGGVMPLSARTPDADALRSEHGVWLESSDEAEARYPHLAEAGRAEGWEAGVALPLRARGHAVGTLALSFRTRRTFDLEERALLLAVAGHCALALDRARLLEAERTHRAQAERDRAVLDGILRNAPVAVALLDRDLRFLHVNPVAAQMDGAPLEAHAGRSPQEILPSLPWPGIEATLRRVLETGTPSLDLPVEVPFPGGQVRHFLASSYRVGAGEETIGVGLIAREVTEAREAQQFQRNVLGIVGHDLRTPLATAKTSALLLGRGAPLDAAQARLVGRITSACARIEQVIGILLDYAQASGGRGVPIRPTRCDLGALCREVADEAEGARPGRAVRCAGEGDPAGEWDPDRLRQALANLVSNALAYGAPDLPVDVRWRGEAGHVEIEVANAGPPIAPDLLPGIFDAFRRGPGDRGDCGGGLGLGLFIARAFAVAHGGAIDVRSGGGETAFTLRLPRRPAARG